MDEVHRNIRLNHLKQLQPHNLVVPPESDLPHVPRSGQDFFNPKKWTEESMTQINAAIANRVYGGIPGSEINFDNAFMAFMESATMYLRDIPLVVKAVNTYRAGNTEDALDLLKASNDRINGIAKMWDMEFIQICDLVNQHPIGHPLIVGPFCGAFVPKDLNKGFFGVAFKGTSTFWEVFNDLLATIPMKVPKDIAWGAPVARGFYLPLFSSFAPGMAWPYIMIENAVKELGTKFSMVSDVHVHVTGHSLGAAYASLCYGQLTARSTGGQLAENLFLGDLYTFGAPRVALEGFAAGLKQNCVSGSSWRIATKGDIVTKVPTRPFMLPPFIHVDSLYTIYPDEAPQLGDTEIGTHPSFIPKLPLSLSDHLPNAYYHSLKYATTRKVNFANSFSNIENLVREYGGKAYFQLTGSLIQNSAINPVEVPQYTTSGAPGTLTMESVQQCTVGIIRFGALAGKITAWGDAVGIDAMNVSLSCTSLQDLYGRETLFLLTASEPGKLQITFVDNDNPVAIAHINTQDAPLDLRIGGTCIWELDAATQNEYMEKLSQKFANASEDILEEILYDGNRFSGPI